MNSLPLLHLQDFHVDQANSRALSSVLDLFQAESPEKRETDKAFHTFLTFFAEGVESKRGSVPSRGFF